MLLNALARNWWMVLLRGIFAVIFGILAIIWPDLTVGLFVAFFGAYALVDGVFTIVAAFQADDRDRLWHIAQGALGILVGIIAWVYPGLTALSLLYFIGAWALITGVIEIVAAIRLRKQITNEFWLILGGVFSVLFGATLIALSFRLRGMQDRDPTGSSQGRAAASA